MMDTDAANAKSPNDQALCDQTTSECEQGRSYAQEAAPAFGDFVDTIALLRAPGGCPWDREQTHQSIAKNMIEEAYEALDTIESGDWTHLREELGDVLLQVVLQSQIAADAHEFTITDVVRGVNAKMIHRHPHVFGQAQAASASEVLSLWDRVKLDDERAKQQEALADNPTGLLEGVPTSFPALMQAQKISRKAVSAGFEWDSLDAVWEQVAEEIQELKTAYTQAPKDEKGKVVQTSPKAQEVELELGDVLFSLVNVGRKMGIDAESALRATCKKFRARWAFMEGAAYGMGCCIEDLPMAELQALWDQSKLCVRS